MYKRISLLYVAFITCTYIAQAADNQLANSVQEKQKSHTAFKQAHINEFDITKKLTDRILARQISVQYLQTLMGYSAPCIPSCQDAFEDCITSTIGSFDLLSKKKYIKERLAALQKNEQLVIYFKRMLLDHHMQYNQALSNKIDTLAHNLIAVLALGTSFYKCFSLYQSYKKEGLGIEDFNTYGLLTSLAGGFFAIAIGSSVIKKIFEKPCQCVEKSIETSEDILHTLVNIKLHKRLSTSKVLRKLYGKEDAYSNR